MIRLLSRLIETNDPALFRQAMVWLYGFVRPHRRAILLLLGLSLCASTLVLATHERGIAQRCERRITIEAGAVLEATTSD